MLMGDADIALPSDRRLGLRGKFINWGTNIVAAFAHLERALGKIFGRPRTNVATENSMRPEMTPELANHVIIAGHAWGGRIAASLADDVRPVAIGSSKNLRRGAL